MINELLRTIRGYCEKRNIDYKNVNVCRQSRRLNNGDFIVPKGCLEDLSSEDISALQDDIVQHSQRTQLPIRRVCQADYHALVLFVDRSKAYWNVINKVLHKGNNYGKTDQSESKTHVVLLNSADVAATCTNLVVTGDDCRAGFHEKLYTDCSDKYPTLKAACPGDMKSLVPATVNDSDNMNPASLSDLNSLNLHSNNTKDPASLSGPPTTTNTDCPADRSAIRPDITGTRNTTDHSSSCDPKMPAASGHLDDHVPDITGDHDVINIQCHDSSNDQHNRLATEHRGNIQKANEISGLDTAYSSMAVHTSDTAESVNQIPVTPLCLRAIAILQHVTELLKATGHIMREVPFLPSPAVLELCHVLGYRPHDSSTNTRTLDAMTHKAEVSPFRHTVNRVTVNQQGSEGDTDSTETDKSEIIVIDLRKYIQEACLVQGRKAYDKNLHFVDVKYVDGPTDVLHRVARLENALSEDSLQPDDVVCVHIVSENLSFTYQQIDLVWRMLSTQQTPVNQSHLVTGSVDCRKEGAGQYQMSAEDFIRLRLQQVKQLSDQKYGDDRGSAWESTLMTLTAAAIKFEMLNTACKNRLKLDVSQHADGGPGAETRAGLFVIYNCARLATLFRHFQQEVQKGVYPELPSIDNVNFDLLREEEEWVLLFNYISVYPDVVLNSVEEIGPLKTDIYAKIHTHKIVNFLISLSRSLSSYYGRILILGEGKQHLLPVMFARLYLMKAIHQVLMNGLLLLEIQPFSQI
ncbi:DALR anticodon-binding domain-containing protein 3-like isoform X2 [Gigantopelta aegis]|uniref:DALR anticodon-binding domain-containing protein 3-like isoform X2 n=1 Tax=Gigantopelta aegis TaxID=1735272 RepID=UPI001B88ABED|nr:DALR anticodon-binding domain-containing protein 3-like isoform X2 [Gigantopelta aegis]